MRAARYITLAICLAAIPTAGLAQVADPPQDEWDSVTDALRGHEWADQINNLLDIVRVMPGASFGFTPAEDMSSFGDVVTHIAAVQFAFCDGIAGNPGMDRPAPASNADKDAVTMYLMGSIGSCDAVFDDMTDAQLVAKNAEVADRITTTMGHTRRETGKLVTYLRLAGVEPPQIEFYKGRKWRTGGS